MKHLMKRYITVFLSIFAVLPAMTSKAYGGDTIPVTRTTDFIPDGKGSNPAWDKAAWHALGKRDTIASDYESKFRILYSEEGLYVLMQGTDLKITSPYKKDFDELYRADVFEVFLHPDPAYPVYFEYEINARGKELVLVIPNKNGRIHGWQPWRYSGDRKVIGKTSVMKSGRKMTGWTAELFFPFRLLAPLPDATPVAGTVWNANFCRLDYDSGKMIKWSWSPIMRHFHEYGVFRSIRFE
jgi:hypothetical protein